MGYFVSLAFVLATLLQAGSDPPAAGDIFSPAEKAQMEQASSIAGRIKIYAAASKRIQQALYGAVAKEEFHTVPDSLSQWTSLLAKSLEDIEANPKAKKKPRALIKYEIQVRKAITDTQGYKLRAPVDQQDVFDSCLDRAETIRKRFVEILFLH